MYKDEMIYINEDVYIWYVKIENVVYIGEYSWCVDEARSQNSWTPGIVFVHFTPHYNQKQTIICRFSNFSAV